MGLASRGLVLLAALLTSGTLTACGGSVADADDPDPVRAAPAPMTPFCAASVANSEAIRPLNGLVAGGDATPEELSNTVEAVRRTAADLVAAAPDDIRADVQRTVQVVNVQLDALLASGGDAGAASRDPAVTAALAQPELAKAGERYRNYVTRTCGLSQR